MKSGIYLNRYKSKEYAFVVCDSDRCIGCGICELVCSLEKSHMKSFNLARARIKVVRVYPNANLALTCRCCEKPPCIHVCPRNALTQLENGTIHVNEDRCIGCRLCVQACPYGAITIGYKEKMVIVCDLCEGREGIGVFPGRPLRQQACIEWCPQEALELITSSRLAQKLEKKATFKLLGT